MAKQGRRLKNTYASLEVDKIFPLDEAVAKIKTIANAKFDETLEVSVALTVDPKRSDQVVRGAVAMPNGLGKKVRVAVFARGDKAKEALDAGADIVGAEDLADQVAKGVMDFDRCIATPDMMAVVGRVGKQLGPRGLMPNPKLGTVTPNVSEAVRVAKSGQVEFRTEKAAIVHAGLGKVSFSEGALLENIRAFFDALHKAKPQGVKGTFVKKVYVGSTMGPSIQVDLASLAA